MKTRRADDENVYVYKCIFNVFFTGIEYDL